MTDTLNTTRKWTDDHARKAAEEGWEIHTSPSGKEEICANGGGDEYVFEDDDQAVGHVYRKAGEGSDLHRLALAHTLRPENCQPSKPQKMHKVFVYGTLRTHGLHSQDPIPWTHSLNGYDMFDTGAYPYILPGVGIIYGNLLDVNDMKLDYLDSYEGLSRGLYTRETVMLDPVDKGPAVEAFVYVASDALVPPLVESGDWFVHTMDKHAKKQAARDAEAAQEAAI